MTRPRILAVAAVLVAVAAVIAFVTIPRSGPGPLRVTAQFEDSIGLYEGNDVSVLGMPVGKVTRITPKDTYVQVDLEIDRGIDIPADVQAVTVSTSILTDRHIELTPAHRGGPTLKTGDILGLPRTRTPVEFDRTLAMIDKLSTSLSGDGHGNGPLADLVNIGSETLTGNGPKITAALDQLSQALRLGDDSGAHTKQDIQAIADNLSQLMESAAENDATIREFGSTMRQLSAILNEEDLGSGATGAKINQILDQATTLLDKNRDGLKSTVTDFRTLTSAVVDNQRELAESFDILPLLGDNLYNAIDQNTGAVRVHALADKLFLNSQMMKEICNLAAIKDLGCATGTINDYGPDFGTKFLSDGIFGMLENMAGVPQ